MFIQVSDYEVALAYNTLVKNYATRAWAYRQSIGDTDGRSSRYRSWLLDQLPSLATMPEVRNLFMQHVASYMRRNFVISARNT